VSAYAIDDGERLIINDPIAVPDDVRALFTGARADSRGDRRDTLIDLVDGLEIPRAGYRKASPSSRSRSGWSRCSTSPWSTCCRRTASPPTARLSSAPSPDPC
jgi:hypothetical protein